MSQAKTKSGSSKKSEPKESPKKVSKKSAKTEPENISAYEKGESKGAMNRRLEFAGEGHQMSKELEEKTICIIRIRGSPGMRRTILNTLTLFNLHHVNHATLVRSNPSVLGMLQKAKDYIAYGTISTEMIGNLLKKRGLLVGNKPLTDNHVKFATDFDSIDNLAKGIFDGKIKMRDVKDLKPIFRLHPPIGGFHKSIKKNVNAGGMLGNHGEKIDLLIKKML